MLPKPFAARGTLIFSWVVSAVMMLAAAEGAPDAEAIHIVLVGDSTVMAKSGWGGAFEKLLARGVRLTNSAVGGQSSNSFRESGKWKEALAKQPTHVLIQFGHNDLSGKTPGLATDPETTYRANLIRFVDEARAAGAQPILVTPIPIRIFVGDKLRGELAPYAAAVRKVAAEKGVPLADLYARGVADIEKLGPMGSAQLGLWLPTGRPDPSHLGKPGAKLTANELAAELRKSAPELARFLRP